MAQPSIGNWKYKYTPLKTNRSNGVAKLMIGERAKSLSVPTNSTCSAVDEAEKRTIWGV